MASIGKREKNGPVCTEPRAFAGASCGRACAHPQGIVLLLRELRKERECRKLSHSLPIYCSHMNNLIVDVSVVISQIRSFLEGGKPETVNMLFVSPKVTMTSTAL